MSRANAEQWEVHLARSYHKLNLQHNRRNRLLPMDSPNSAYTEGSIVLAQPAGLKQLAGLKAHLQIMSFSFLLAYLPNIPPFSLSPHTAEKQRASASEDNRAIPDGDKLDEPIFCTECKMWCTNRERYEIHLAGKYHKRNGKRSATVSRSKEVMF